MVQETYRLLVSGDAVVKLDGKPEWIGANF